MSARVGIITGLAKEQRCLSARQGTWGIAATIVCAGARPAEAARAARLLLSRGDCQALVSFGVAGGLAPALAAGTLVIADRVIGDDGQASATDDDWRQRLVARLRGAGEVAVGSLMGCSVPVMTVATKARLHRRTGALAIDMESAAVAAAAAAAAVPFVVIRAIADPADRGVPGWVLATLDDRGRPEMARLLAGVVRHPRDVPALIGLARDQAAAFAALRRVAVDGRALFQLRG